MSLANYIRSADWKAEKHVPVITVVGQFAPEQPLDVEVSVGKEIPHPNTVEHHIVWIVLYYVAEGSQLPVELGRAEFCAHGPAATSPVAKFRITLDKPGMLFATAYCNLHGLWDSSQRISPMGSATWEGTYRGCHGEETYHQVLILALSEGIEQCVRI